MISFASHLPILSVTALSRFCRQTGVETRSSSAPADHRIFTASIRNRETHGVRARSNDSSSGGLNLNLGEIATFIG
jgi:hypothetical protein